MTEQERMKVGEYWLGLASMYGKDISRVALKIMLDAVSDLDATETLNAFNDWVKEKNHTRYPLPGDVRAMVVKELDDDTVARETASRIMAAVSKFGHPSPDKAKDYIGELGWRIVERYGGWNYICENLGDSLDNGTFQAQARDLAKAQIILCKNGFDDFRPSLPAPKSSIQQLGSDSRTHKLIEGLANQKRLE